MGIGWGGRLALLLAASGLLAGCGDFGEDDVKGALDGLPYDIEYREVAVPDGAEGAVAGRATNEEGAIVDFAVTIVDASVAARPTEFPVVQVPGGGGLSSYSGEGTSYIYTSNGHASPKDSTSLEESRSSMRLDIELAICRAAFGDRTKCI